MQALPPACQILICSFDNSDGALAVPAVSLRLAVIFRNQMEGSLAELVGFAYFRDDGDG